MKAQFLESQTIKQPHFGTEMFEKLSIFWNRNNFPVPIISMLARDVENIIVVLDDCKEIIATAFVHKTKVAGIKRTKHLMNITFYPSVRVVTATEAFKEMLKLFTKKGSKKRSIYIELPSDRRICTALREVCKHFGFIQSTATMTQP